MLSGCGARRAERALDAGIEMAEQGQDRRAAVLLERAARKLPRNASAHANLGLVWLRQGETVRALASLRRAAELAPEDPRPLLLLGQAFAGLERWDEARRVLAEAQARAQESPAILTTRAVVEYRAGDVEEAVRLLSLALTSDPLYAPALYDMALVQRARSGGRGAAGAYYDRYLRTAPADELRAGRAREFLSGGAEGAGGGALPPDGGESGGEDAAGGALADARDAIRQGDLTRALVTLKEIFRSHPDDADAWWELATIYDTQLKDAERAADLYRRFAQAFPRDARARVAARRVERAAERASRVPLAEVVRRARPDPAAAKEAMDAALAAHRAHDWGRAAAAYLAVIESDPGSVLAALNLGLVYIADEEMAAARDALEYALQLDARRTDTRYRLASVYRELGMPQQALEQAQAIVKQQPDDAPTHQMLGLLYADAGKGELARLHLRRFVELAPDDPHAAQTRAWLRENE
jgi:tetratricopeptide (TPR) repeat protein